MKHFEMPLDIEDVEIERVELKENGEIIIIVTSTVEGTYCHRCGQKITDSYGYDREITLRHLSILGRPTYIQIRPKRYRCCSCSDVSVHFPLPVTADFPPRIGYGTL
jgi:transposase